MVVEVLVVVFLVAAIWLGGRWSRRRAADRLRVSRQTVARLRTIEGGLDEDRQVYS